MKYKLKTFTLENGDRRYAVMFGRGSFFYREWFAYGRGGDNFEWSSDKYVLKHASHITPQEAINCAMEHIESHGYPKVKDTKLELKKTYTLK